MFLDDKRKGEGPRPPRDRYYILVNHQPVPCDDMIVWALWFSTSDRKVACTPVHNVNVSTVCIGLDHNFSGVGPPLIFETMIFGGGEDGWCERCSTWAEAESVHREAMHVARRARRKPTAHQVQLEILQRMCELRRKREST